MQIQPIQHPLTGLFEGIQRGISLGLTMNKLKQEQQEREELLNLQKQRLQAEQEYQERQNALRQFGSGLKILSDKNIPKAIKLDIYNNTVVPAAKSLGFQIAGIDDWPDGIDDYVKRALAIYNNKDYTWDQKLDFITEIMIEAGDDPRFKLLSENINKKLEQEQQLAEQRAYDLHYRLLSGKTAPDEVNALTEELGNILNKYPNAYGRARQRAIEDRRNELLMQKTQKEIETPKTEYKLYYNPKTGQTMYVNILNPTEEKSARNQGYRPWVADIFRFQTGGERYTLPQKLDDLRAEYNRMVDTLDRKYGLKGGGIVSKTLLDLDETRRTQYLRDLDNINAAYNKRYKELTGRDAPFLVSPKTTNAGKQSSGVKPSLDEIFRGK